MLSWQAASPVASIAPSLAFDVSVLYAFLCSFQRRASFHLAQIASFAPRWASFEYAPRWDACLGFRYEVLEIWVSCRQGGKGVRSVRRDRQGPAAQVAELLKEG
jgi:hypothetical protein|eukprot:1797389-Prymnesium_polylepis.4